MSRKNSANAFANSLYLIMNERDAEKEQFTACQQVRVISAIGELETVIRVGREVAEGELYMPWHSTEAPVNRLTRSELDPYLKNAHFKYPACRVEDI